MPEQHLRMAQSIEHRSPQRRLPPDTAEDDNVIRNRAIGSLMRLTASSSIRRGV
jgi:hypothetical protein